MTRSREWVERVLTGVMLVCAIVVTYKLVVGDSPPPPADVAVEDWTSVVDDGRRFGPVEARATLVVFTDLECPACRQFHTATLPAVRARHDADLAVVYRHWPLGYHRFAYSAARAAECAAGQGRFEPFLDAVFARQDSLGLKPLSAFALEAGVTDLPAFEACTAAPDSLPRITKDVETITGIGGRGTPAVMLNGILLGRVPDANDLTRRIDRVLRRN
ncbi:MAG: thioredoxin domain-containing protein [Gemmatimonadales bacterium]|nr:thioredoxin domain-containing protein [Gemmatimonadales bacterium]MDZ4391329.1 thioredoxin domain-containing protein [Gemmatimonadales bacterium]